jgi:hypothetical protein
LKKISLTIFTNNFITTLLGISPHEIGGKKTFFTLGLGPNAVGKSLQPYVIVCDDWRQVRDVLNTTWWIVCDDWRQARGVLNTTICDRFCDDWRQIRGVLGTTLCDSL